MKYFCLLFTFYLLTISVLPCSDTVECNDAIKIEIAQNKNHDDHDHETEQCPPFCSCACCGVQIFQLQPSVGLFERKIAFFESKQQASFYSFIYNKSITSAIWQPPKIA